MRTSSMKWVGSAVLAGVFSLVLVGMAFADDVTDSIEEGLKAYKKGSLTEAAQSLDYASQLIRQKKGGKLKVFLPKPLPGWKAEEASSEATGAAMFGGGVTAKRTYNRNSSEVDVEIVTDAPMLQGMMMMFSNPMFAVSQGGKLEKVAGQKAIVKYSASDKQGEIKIAVANRILVTVSGSDVSKNDLKSYAERIDYGKLASLP